MKRDYRQYTTHIQLAILPTLKEFHMKSFFHLLLLTILLGMLSPFQGIAQAPGRGSFIEGENMRKQNRCDDAINKYNQAISVEPDNFKYFFARGKCEYRLKRFDDAKESFKSTVQIRADYSPAYSLLAKLYKNENNVDEAVYYYEQAARYERSNARKVQYKLLLINLLLKEDRTYDARRHIEDARQLDPTNPNILYYTAEIAAQDENWSRAKQDYEMALNSDKLKNASPASQAKYYYGLGLAYSKLGDNNNARLAWRKANFGPYKKMIQQQLQQTSHVYFYKIALSYYLNGEYQESEQYIDRALELQRDFSSAFILRGKIEKKRGNISRAIQHYQDAIQMEKNPQRKAKMYSLVANLQLNNNDSYGALNSLERALEASPSNSRLLYMRAKAEYGSGRYRDAIFTLDKLLSAGVDTKSKARYNFMKGMAARRAGDPTVAEEAFLNARYGPFKPAATIELEKLKGRE
jgi:tetratricopeptide (TPR) repeat protein